METRILGWMRMMAVGVVALMAVGGLQAQGPYYEEVVADSNPHRAEQARELDEYVKRLKGDDTRLRRLFKPDFSSVSAYLRSTQRYRKAFADAIGYPPPGEPEGESRFERIGEDTVATYYRAWIPVLPGVHCYGLYLVPKNLKGRAPLVISMHGGGGSPEVALFRGGANYHDMVRGGVKRGYVVWALQHLFSAQGYPGDIRNRIDRRMRLVGTTLTAVEIAKISRSLDVILKRPEVDPKRVGMVGLSYGGFYSLIAPAFEPRIKAISSSCYYGVQEYRYNLDELSVPSDFEHMDRMSLFKDSELVALICPRPLEIQAGEKDAPTHREMGKILAPKSAEYYEKLGKGKDFRFLVFPGGHEFYDPSAWEWLEKHL